AGASSPPLTLFLHAGDPPHPRRPSFPTRRSSDLPDAPDGHGGLLFEGNISASCPTGRYLQGHHALCGHGLCQHVPALHLPAAGLLAAKSSLWAVKGLALDRTAPLTDPARPANLGGLWSSCPRKRKHGKSISRRR